MTEPPPAPDPLADPGGAEPLFQTGAGGGAGVDPEQQGALGFTAQRAGGQTGPAPPTALAF